jgi:predicted GH43/DUF377 family glycosyl hydrolase
MKFKVIALTCVFCFFATLYLTAVQPILMDLEGNNSNFILKSTKIEIPGYPNACNGSIVRWQGGVLMSFRDIYDPIITNPCDGSGLGGSSIGLVWLDSNFHPIGEPQFLEFEAFSFLPSMPEDPRLIVVNDALYMVYSDNAEIEPGVIGTRTCIAHIGYNLGLFWVQSDDCLINFERNERYLREKNWVPFAYDNILLLAYSLLPHRILLPMLGTDSCTTIYLTRGLIHWSWGILRGGTPGLQIDETQYLAFFHSVLEVPTVHSHGLTIPHYFIGAYTFNSAPPFQITQMSASPIIAQGFYNGLEYEPYWNPVRVVFPCGYIFDDNYIWLSYGRQDHEIWIVQMDKALLLQSLIPIQTRHL